MDYLIITKKGNAITLDGNSVPTLIGHKGVSLMRMVGDDEIASVVAIPENSTGHILFISKKGFGAKVPVNDLQKAWDILQENDEIASAILVD